MPASVNVGPSKPRIQPVSDAGSSGGATRGIPVTPPSQRTPPPGVPDRQVSVTPAPTPKQAAANAAANSNTSLQSYLSYLQTNMGRTAQSIIDAEVNPIIAGYTAQQKAGDQAIVGNTQTYVNELQNIGAQANQAYTTAETQQSALDTAIGSALQNGDVGAAASRLSTALASAGQNTAPGAAAQAAASSTGASMYASGSASLSQLFAQGAAQNAYDATLPGIAKAAGLQGLATYNAGLTSAEQAAVQAAQDKLPSIMGALNTQARTQVAAAAESFKENQPKIYGGTSSGYFAILPNGDNVQLTAPGAKAPKVFGSSTGGYYTVNDSGTVVPLVGGSGKAPTTKTVGGVLYQYDQASGKWIKAVGTPKPGPLPGALPKGVTASEISNYVKGLEIKAPAKQGGGITGHTTSYQDAYKYLTTVYHLSDVQARTALDTSFAKGGSGGRSWLTNEQQAALKPFVSQQPRDFAGGVASVQSATPIIIGGHAYLSPNQYSILKAKGIAPKVVKGPAPPTGPYAHLGVLYNIVAS